MYEQLIVRLANALARSRIPYMIIGGQAVLLYGEPRLTKDIDITLGVDVDELDDVLTLVENLNLTVLVERLPEFVAQTRVLPASDPESGARIDFIFSNSNYERQAIENAQHVKILDIALTSSPA